MCNVGNKTGIFQFVSFQDFKRLFKTFSYYPFYENWSDDKLTQEYKRFDSSEAAIFGYYENGVCIGLVSIRPFSINEFPISFAEDQKTMYLSDLILDVKHNNIDIGVSLINQACSYSKKMGYSQMCFRYKFEVQDLPPVQCAKESGFKTIWDCCQEVEFERTYSTGKRGDVKDLRMFMIKKIE